MHPDLVVTSPADSAYAQQFEIHSDCSMSSQETGNRLITLKHTHTFGNIGDLLNGSAYSTLFANGKFVHYFLSPFSYHRFHAPVSGKVLESYVIHGKVKLDVKVKNGVFNAPDSAENGYQFRLGFKILITCNSRF